MNSAILGAVAGAAFGIFNFVLLKMLADRIEFGKLEGEPRKPEDLKKTAQILRIVGWIDIVLFTVVGYFVGPYVF